MEFIYNIPTKIIFSRNAVTLNSGELKKCGSNALIVTGKKSAKINGSYRDITDALDKENIKHHLFDRIEANPSVETVREAAAEARAQRADFIIGIGGGSPLDAAKAIAILASNDIDDETLFSGIFPVKPLPVVAVPTTAGTGSEVTPYSILTYNKIKNKKSISSDTIFPVLSLLDPAYTDTLNYTTTVNTAIDALSHSVEGYLSKRASAVIEPFAIESIKILGTSLKLLTGGENPEADTREQLLYASMLAGIVIAHTGTTIVHAMGYPLTYYRDIDHGRANGLLMYEFFKFLKGSSRVEKILDAMNMTLDQFGDTINTLLGEKEKLSDEEIALFTATAESAQKNIANTSLAPASDDIKNIFIKSFR